MPLRLSGVLRHPRSLTDDEIARVIRAADTLDRAIVERLRRDATSDPREWVERYCAEHERAHGVSPEVA